MPRFSFVAKDKNGKSYKNVVDDVSRAALIDKLQKQGYFIVSIKQVKESSAAFRAPKSKKRKFTHKNIKLDDLLTFSKQLATMLESGVTLIRTLNVIENQIESEKLYNVVIRIKSDIEQGSSLSEALARHPKVFNQFWVSLMEVGEASGTIPVVLNKLNFYLNQQAAFKSTIISGIIYPAILFVVASGAIVFFALFVGPQFESVFKSMNADLPVITTTLLETFNYIKVNFIKIIIISGIVIFSFYKYSKTYNGGLRVEKFIYSLPTIGIVYRNIIVERFASQMSILIDSGVPILYALEIAEKLVNNKTCSLVVNDIKERVREGELIVAPMERSGFFPPMATQMILVGEETGELSKMLKHVSVFYQNNVETFMKRFATIIEPFMLVFMGAVIGTIVLAMFMPMFNIAQMGRG